MPEAECAAPVVPPGKRPGIAVPFAEEINQPTSQKRVDSLPLFGCVEDLPVCGVPAPTVDRLRDDVEIPAKDPLPGVARRPEGREVIQPRKFPAVVLMFQGLAVRAIDSDKSQSRDAGAHESRSHVILARQAAKAVFDRQAGQHGDPVPALLPVQDHLVAQLRERRMREIVGLGLDLLQTDDVRPALIQPDTDEVQTGAQTVHVPGRDTHADILTDLIQQRASLGLPTARQRLALGPRCDPSA